MGKILKKPAVLCTLALVCCALWGSAFPCVKIGYELFSIKDTGSQLLFAGCRFFLAGILTFLMGSVIEKRVLRMRRASVPYIFGIGFLQTTIQYLCFYIALAHTTGVKGSVINACNAFVTIVIAHFVFKDEKMTMKKGAGCLLGIAGVIIINLSPGAWGSSFSMAGEGMMILCTLVYGTCSVLMKLISEKGTPMEITAYQLLFGGAVLILFGAAAGGRISGFTWKSSALLFYMAMLSAVAFSLWTSLLKYNPVGKVAIFGFSIPIFGSALSAVFLGEQIFKWKNLIALFCVCAGIIMVNQVQSKQKDCKDVSSQSCHSST